MEPNAIPGGMYSNNMQAGMIGLEMSLHHSRPPQKPHHPIGPAGADGHHDYHTQTRQQPYTYGSVKSSKPQTLTLSDDEEAGFDTSADDSARKMSPWQRMKWTDNMVRLLIMVVFYIGDEVGSAAAAVEGSDPKKKGGGALQKKGKWKSVSRAMMERGFYVSPQQCEDKFNDLNKRYKRVNDILGKGTACRVVENQNLLDTMDHLSPKLKEEVKKLLNSKHLFFKEMCAYHSSCGHGGDSVQPEAAAEPSCQHSSENAPNLSRDENEGSKMAKGGMNEDDNDDDDDEDGDNDEDDEFEEEDDENVRKRARVSAAMQQLGAEVMAVVQDGGRSRAEKVNWMRTKAVELEEERVGLQARWVEMERRRLKWVRFSGKKEREMERVKLAEERRKLENERMLLILRRQEIDLVMGAGDGGGGRHACSNRRNDPSSVTG